MKSKYSLNACIVISAVLLLYRLCYSGLDKDYTLRITTWDSFGYYMYLPSVFIYDDATKLKWMPEMNKKYHLWDGDTYQAHVYKNGNYVFKYFGGIAIMEIPWFLIGHGIAKTFHFDADGFSPPYQYALAFGVLVYCLLSIFLLRRILLNFFSDKTTALTLVLVMLATNIIQYVAIDSAQSHGYIFPLYVLILYLTVRWHENPTVLFASLIGYVIGLAIICRPTEVIMLIIPLLWGTQNKEAARAKWALVKQHHNHIIYAILFAFLGVLPQLIYWQMASGFFIYNVGSKWAFLNPFFRVLFGFEKGWFIYTPVTIFFIAGMFYMKPYPFKKPVLWFCLLNIWIVISWFDWRYGGSYSARALSQSYPAFALPLAAFIEHISIKKWRFIFYIFGLYLTGVNLFQIVQYNRTILHYNDMNGRYYAHIYLNPRPTPLDMSLLDSNDYLCNENGYKPSIISHVDTARHIKVPAYTQVVLLQAEIKPDSLTEAWLKVEVEVKVSKGFSDSYLCSEIGTGYTVKQNKLRLFSPISKEGAINKYAWYCKPLSYSHKNRIMIYLLPQSDFEGDVENLKITLLENNKGN